MEAKEPFRHRTEGLLFLLQGGECMLTESELKTISGILHEVKHIENLLFELIDGNEIQLTNDSCIRNAAASFSLSEREADVLRLIADGRSNSEISEQIQVSVSTVKKHVYNIFNKAGVNSRTQLLNMVYSLGK